jgi:transglutaminase superfamily protein
MQLSMRDYFLPKHVHFCRRGDAFVFLDLRQDDYTLVDGDLARVLEALCTRHLPERWDLAEGILQQLLEGGLITTDELAGRRIAPTAVRSALEQLVDPFDMQTRARVRAIHLYRFLCACMTAALRLRFDSIGNIVDRVAQRKRERQSGREFDVALTRQLVSLFQTLRTLVPRDYVCLYDSLALIEFLASYDIFPTWVFGVKLEPWSAHCWVQESSFAFNEDVEEAAGYSAIMAI